jgi:hypothetical protein
MGETVKKSNAQTVDTLRKTLNLYKKELGFSGYTEETVIDDLLYFVGYSLSKEYAFADGYDKFKQRLREHLKEV